MTTRREVLKTASLAAIGAIGAAFGVTPVFSAENSTGNLTENSAKSTDGKAGEEFVSQRPAAGKRKFVSEAVETKIVEVKKGIADPELAWLFENCFPNTLDTTITHHGKRSGKWDTFVITGDIAAMWLRDSTAQVTPYLPLCKNDTKLKSLILGVVNRQTECVRIDTYANAFNYDASEKSHWHNDKTAMKPELHERKWEIDSLCYAVRLAYLYWKATGDSSFMDAAWREAMTGLVKTLRVQQRKTSDGDYSFKREFAAWPGDVVANNGLGNPTKKIGMIHSAFRPSDDACLFPFLVPSNLFAVTALRQLAELLEADSKVNGKEKTLEAECRSFADEVASAIDTHAKVTHKKYGAMYAFEVDGYGSSLCMDDANIPCLLSLPYLGAVSASDVVYQATRRFVLSEDNPYFFRGKAGEGLGGPHAGQNQIWHLGIIARALTSTDDAEILLCLRTLKATHAGTGLMHEAFDKDDAKKFTRTWFAWANTLFGELIVKLHTERPHLLRQSL